MTHRNVQVVQDYFVALTAGDVDAIVSVFSDDGEVSSPFLGVLPAADFYARLDQASAQSVLSVLDVLTGVSTATIAARFRYDWTLQSGDQIVFEGMDHFTFNTEGKIRHMRIYYDTHPVREDVGDKYN
ncbi:MAG: nuclear transport factor 2 family protein [Paracoccaceae bacterium]